MNHPPGPRGHFIFGCLKEIGKDPLAFTTDLAKEYPGIARFRFLNRNVYVISSPECVTEIIQSGKNKFVKSRHYKFLKLSIGTGLLTSEGEVWRKQRKLTQPAFHKSSISSFISTFIACSDEVAKEWEEVSKSPEAIDILPEMSALAFQIIGKTLLSVDMKEEATQFRTAIKYGLKFINKRQNSFFNFPIWFPTKSNRLFLKHRGYMDDIIYKIIEERLNSKSQKDDLLGMFISSIDENTGKGMTRVQLRDEMMTMILAGFETTTIALTWTWYLLHKNPAVADKLYESIKNVKPEIKSLEEWYRPDYLSMVINESMRLYPPIYNLGRMNLAPAIIGGYSIKKGSVFLINSMALHRNVKNWENPDDFIPERFENEKDFEKNAYIPFGSGQRKCIGNNFAMLEMKVIIHTLLQKYTLTLKENHPIELVPAITLNPKYGISMHIRKRK